MIKAFFIYFYALFLFIVVKFFFCIFLENLARLVFIYYLFVLILLASFYYIVFFEIKDYVKFFYISLQYSLISLGIIHRIKLNFSKSF